jgi:hypothetical protein
MLLLKLLSPSKIPAVMEKHTDEAHGGFPFPSKPEPRVANSRSEIFIDLGCGVVLWVCGAALSTIQLALQERSHNALLRHWQDVSSNTNAE